MLIGATSGFLFGGWSTLWRTLVVGALAYVALVVLLRLSGKRTLSKMNAFDLVVTVALGSTLATILLNSNVALAEGVVAFMLLIGLQLAVTWMSVRSRLVSRLVKATPSLLVYEGQFLDDAMRRERVTREEILAGVRAAQLVTMEQVKAVVLETDGSITVIPHPSGDAARAGAPSSLEGIKIPGGH